MQTHTKIRTPYDQNCILNDTADEIEKQTGRILAENAKDLERMDKENPMYDRLKLTEGRIEGIAGDMRNVDWSLYR